MTQFDLPILVPRRADNGRRDDIWHDLKLNYWWDCNVFEGVHEGPGPFNRSAALNAASDAAGDWKCAVIADADSILQHQSLLFNAAAIAMKTNRLVIPHSRWVNVDEDEVGDFIAGRSLFWRAKRTRYNTTVSSMLVVPRSVWDTVNGFDERFVGWGWEDTAFMHAVDVLTEGHIRLEGDVYHLAHDRPQADVSRTLDSGYIANTNHFRNAYKRTTDPAQMRRVVTKNR